MARGALVEAAKSLDPGLRYRALYNLGLVGLLAARADTSRQEELLDDATDRLRQALLLEPSSARAKWNLELAERRRPPPPPQSGGGGAPPPPSGGPKAPEPRPPQPEPRDSVAEPGRADPQLDGAARAVDPRGAAAPHAGRLVRRSEGLVMPRALAIGIAVLPRRVGPSHGRRAAPARGVGR